MLFFLFTVRFYLLKFSQWFVRLSNRGRAVLAVWFTLSESSHSRCPSPPSLPQNLTAPGPRRRNSSFLTCSKFSLQLSPPSKIFSPVLSLFCKCASLIALPCVRISPLCIMFSQQTIERTMFFLLGTVAYVCMLNTRKTKRGGPQVGGQTGLHSQRPCLRKIIQLCFAY